MHEKSEVLPLLLPRCAVDLEKTTKENHPKRQKPKKTGMNEKKEKGIEGCAEETRKKAVEEESKRRTARYGFSWCVVEREGGEVQFSYFPFSFEVTRIPFAEKRNEKQKN